MIYGSASGLTAKGNQIWHQDSEGILDEAMESEWFGGALAAGDFDCDGWDDLAIGVAGEGGGFGSAGAVSVIYGSAAGLSATGNQHWTQDSPGILDSSEPGDGFGGALAAGDFDGDGCADLAVGASGEKVGELTWAGAVSVLYGSPGSGLTANGDQFWHQNTTGVLGKAEWWDLFGAQLAACDFDGDGRADLAISVRYEGVNGVDNAGAVNVLYGSASGLSSAGDQIWHQDSDGVLDTAEEWDEFGANGLATGDFDNDGGCDLAIAVTKEDIDGLVDAGAVHVLYGGVPYGLSSVGDQLWHQNTAGVRGKAEAGDSFGGF